jgi:hypothetical protein
MNKLSIDKKSEKDNFIDELEKNNFIDELEKNNFIDVYI